MSNYIIPTFTGKLFDLLEPTEDMICIEDIAHHLSIENRFNGATKFPYSVGYHSILVCEKVVDPRAKLEALLHDAEEAYYKDWTRPLKYLVGKDVYDKLTWKFMDYLAAKFKLNKLLGWYVKEIDMKMCATEIKLLLANFPEEVWTPIDMTHEVYNGIDIMKLSAENVEALFLKEYEKWRRD